MLLRLFMSCFVGLLSIQRILSDLLRCPKTLICPDTRLLPMSPMRLPLCPKSSWAAFSFQPRNLYCSPFFGEGDKPINVRLFTHLYYKIKLLLSNFSDQLKKPDSLQLEISPVMDIIRKSWVTGQTIRTPRLPHFQSLVYQRFRRLYFSIFRTILFSFHFLHKQIIFDSISVKSQQAAS